MNRRGLQEGEQRGRRCCFISDRIHTSDPEASISAQEKEMETLDGDAGRKNKLSSAETGGRVMV